MHLHVYTDGSQIKKPHTAPKTGYGFYIREWDVRVSRNLPGTTETNNRAELSAIAHALETISAEMPKKSGMPSYPTRVFIYTDSQYALQVINKWILRPKKPVEIDAPNADLIARIRDGLGVCTKLVPVEFFKVQAHTALTDDDAIGNSIADELANSAAMDAETTRSEERTTDSTTYGSSAIPVFQFGKYKGFAATIANTTYLTWVKKEYDNSSKWTMDTRINENIRRIIEWFATKSAK